MRKIIPPTAPIPKPEKKSREFVMKSQQAMIDTYAWECCINCDHFSQHHVVRIADETKYSGWREEDRGEWCLQFEAKPPAKVQLIGCEAYEPAIPF